MNEDKRERDEKIESNASDLIGQNWIAFDVKPNANDFGKVLNLRSGT